MSTLLWVVVGLYALFVVLFRVPVVQNVVGAWTAEALSDKLGTKVEVGRVDIGLFNRLIVDDVTVSDQSGKDMLQVVRISATIDILPLMHGQVSISSAQLFGARLNLYKMSAQSKPNYQFVLDSLSSKDDKKKSSLNLHVNSFIMRHSSVRYDRYDVAQTNGRFNPAHLNVSDISANIQLKVLRRDSVNLYVRRVALAERSGIKVSRLSLKLEGGRHGLRLHDMALKLPTTSVTIPEIVASYRCRREGLPDIQTIRYRGDIEGAPIALSELACFIPKFRAFTTPFVVSARFEGTSERLDVKSLKVNSVQADLALNAGGWIEKRDGHTLWHADLRKLEAHERTVELLYHALAGPSDKEPEVVTRLGDIRLSGVASSSAREKVVASITVFTDLGEADADFALRRDDSFTASLHPREIDLGRLFDNEKLGQFTAVLDVNGRLEKGTPVYVAAKGDVNTFGYAGYTYRDITMDGNFAHGAVSGKFGIDDPNVCVEMEGTVNALSSMKDARLKASIKRFVPAGLNLTNRWGDADFSAMIDVDVNGSNVNDTNGSLAVSDLHMKSSTTDYMLNKLDLKAWHDQGKQCMTLQGDFGHAELVGRFNLSTVASSLSGFVKRQLPGLPLSSARSSEARNDFLVSADIYKTDWLDVFFGVPLHIGKPIELNGKVDDERNSIYMNCVAPDLNYNGSTYRDVTLSVTTPTDLLYCDIHLTKLLDNGDKLVLGMTGQAKEDKLSARLSWNNTKGKRIAGHINADARLQELDGKREVRVDVKPSVLDIDGTKWNVAPSSVVYSDNRLMVNRFSVSHSDQHIIVDGTASKSKDDSLVVDLNGVDVGYVLNLVNFHAVDIAGQASGRAYLKAPFGDMSAQGRLKVSKFKFENGDMGTLDAGVKWNKSERQIDIDAVASDGPAHLLFVNGYVSPARGHIDLAMRAEGTSIAFLHSFTDSFTDDVEGTAKGQLQLHGPFGGLNLTGRLVVNGAATITPLGCRYALHNDTVTLSLNSVELRHAEIRDKYGNRGFVDGNIYHRNLKDMSYDVRVEAENLMVYDFEDFDDDVFYGTVYGTGRLGLRGRKGELNMDVNIEPRKNTTFVYNVSNPDAISNQEFIHWNDITPTGHAIGLPEDSSESAKPRLVERLPNTDVRINFILDVTPDATIKLLMDSRTNDYITLNGHGALRASYYNKGNFNMYGTYTIDHGTYGVTIQDIIKKNFVFNEGGTVVFGGDPYDAALDMQAVYTVNGVSLSDLNIGNSFSSNTIKVNCLMNIGGQVRQPDISFDIDMPTVSTDEKQMVRAVLNSEDEMNQQVLYLLGIGRFYPQGSNNASVQTEKQQSQTSLAMQSLLSGTISSQVNSLLGTLIKNNNWNFSANISTGDEGWNNAEYEGLLSGRLLNNRLLINGQFGYRDKAATATTSFIGDFDIKYLLLPNGNLSLKVYNQTNDRYFTRSSLNTQGVGLIMKKDFSNLSDLFGIKKKKKKK